MNKYVLAALMAGVSASAFAADLPTRKAPPAPPIVYAPAFTWTGFYVGLNGGWGWGSLSSSNFSAPTGGVLGGQVGYNYQIGQFVIGGEADLDGTFFSHSSNYLGGTNKFSTGALTTERVRLGIGLDRTLLFLTGGYAGLQTTGKFTDGFTNIVTTQDVWRNGGAIGAGIEYAFTNNITAKAEYLYLPFSGATYFQNTPITEKNTLDVSLFRVGVNYKF